MIRAIIVLEWLAILIGAATFLVIYGRPWRKGDVTMAWHITSVTAVAFLEIVGLLMTGVSLVPSAIAYGLSTAIIYWRIGLLLRSRRPGERTNLMNKLAPYAKGLVAVASAALVAAQTVLPMSATWHGWAAVAVAVLGAAGVYLWPNAPIEGKTDEQAQ